MAKTNAKPQHKLRRKTSQARRQDETALVGRQTQGTFACCARASARGGISRCGVYLQRKDDKQIGEVTQLGRSKREIVRSHRIGLRESIKSGRESEAWDKLLWACKAESAVPLAETTAKRIKAQAADMASTGTNHNQPGSERVSGNPFRREGVRDINGRPYPGSSVVISRRSRPPHAGE